MFAINCGTAIIESESLFHNVLLRFRKDMVQFEQELVMLWQRRAGSPGGSR
jgi:hypothetical protein